MSLLRDHDVLQEKWPHFIKDRFEVVGHGVDLGVASHVRLYPVVGVADILRQAEACFLEAHAAARRRHFPLSEDAATPPSVSARELKIEIRKWEFV